MYIRQDRFVAANVGWIMAILFVFVLLDTFSYELLFILSFIGFLVITVVTMPYRVMAPWQRRIRWIIFFGIIVFVYIVGERLVGILYAGVL